MDFIALPIQNLFPFEVAKCNAMQASSIKQMDENEMKAAKKSSKATYLPYLHTKEQNCNKIGIQKFRLSFLYSINILNFLDSKSSTHKSGPRWLNFKMKF